MNRTQVIVHPYDMAQPDWVRCILPCLQFMGKNDFQIIPSITEIICTNKDALKQTRAVVLQKPTAPGRAQIALYYAKLKKECGFKLVTDMDDLLWDLSPIIASYAKHIPNHDQMMLTSLKQVLPLFDTVVCSTRYLASRVKSDLGVNAVVMPNGVSKSLFGMTQRKSAFTGVPKVMYAGSLGHFADGVQGDLEGAWIPWIRKHVADGSIDLYIFGEPDFLKDLEGKYTKLPYTNFLPFAQTVASYKPDFFLAPLAPNNFNRAKSDLKLKEAAALGAVFIGSDFASSPYSYAPKEQLVASGATVDDSMRFSRISANRKNSCRPSTGSTRQWKKSTGRTKIRNFRKNTSRRISVKGDSRAFPKFQKLLFIPKLVGGTFNFALADNFINTLAEKRFCVNIEKFTFLCNIKSETLDVESDTDDGQNVFEQIANRRTRGFADSQKHQYGAANRGK